MDKLDLTYEEALEKLKCMLEELDRDNCTLEDSLHNFREGVKLYNYLNKMLNKAEGEVTLLLEKDSGIKEIEFPLEV